MAFLVVKFSRVQWAAIKALELDGIVAERRPASPAQAAFAAALRRESDGRVLLEGDALAYAAAADGGFYRAAALFTRTNHPMLARRFRELGDEARAAVALGRTLA